MTQENIPGDHPPGSLNTTPPPFFVPRIVPVPDEFSLEDDEPLTGGACDLDGPCESCQ